EVTVVEFDGDGGFHMAVRWRWWPQDKGYGIY
ncbi:hypothetical protein Tco_1511320, partial [Tanacetum coccineum]